MTEKPAGQVPSADPEAVSRSDYDRLVEQDHQLGQTILDLMRQQTEVRRQLDRLMTERLEAWREEFADDESPRTPDGWGWVGYDQPTTPGWQYEVAFEFHSLSHALRADGAEAAVYAASLYSDEAAEEPRERQYMIPAAWVFGEKEAR